MTTTFRTLIVGAGAVGRTAKVFFPEAITVDQQTKPRELSRNFGTQYLWKPLPGIPCCPFTVKTTIDGKTPTRELAVKYKAKIGKESERYLPTLMDQFQPEQRAYRVQHDKWPDPRPVLWGRELISLDPLRKLARFSCGSGTEEEVSFDILISTIPFFILFKTLTNVGVPDAEEPFHYRPVYVIREAAVHGWDLMQVNYISASDDPVYRTCKWGNFIQHESLEIPPDDLPSWIETHVLFPGKIWPNPVTPPVVGQLMVKNIYCVGRYGRWEPDELLHETVQRIAKIPGARKLEPQVIC
jgi:hypothetical protein